MPARPTAASSRGAAPPPTGEPRCFGLDAPVAQLLGEGLPPAVQIDLARVQALAVLGLGPDADVHMWVGLVVVQHHHLLVIRQLDLGELARGVLQAQRVGPAWHRQHDIEGLAPLSGFGDVVDPSKTKVVTGCSTSRASRCSERRTSTSCSD